MSQKITAKNLSYDTTLPPFLARLHGRHQQQQSSDAPDPMLAARRRPGARVRSASEEAEDAPLVVDERGHAVVTAVDDEQQEFDVDGETGDVVVRRKKEKEEEEEESKKDGVGGDGDGDGDAAEREQKERERVAAIGAGRKRKVGRVVRGGDDEDEAGGSNSDVRKTAKTKHASSTDKDANSTTATAKPPPKKKAKKKKIQLSFGDDDGE